MGSLSIWHWMVVLLVVLLLFGSGKVSTLMGDFAKGIKAFKKGMADDEAPAQPEDDTEHAAPDDGVEFKWKPKMSASRRNFYL